MMDPSNINSFEDQWRKALGDASETPPPSVWAGIEARLDKEEVKVVPLWWQSPKMWYAAASLAALLLVGGGLWFAGKGDEKVQVAVSSKPAQEAIVKEAQPSDEPVAAASSEATQLATRRENAASKVVRTETVASKEPDVERMAANVPLVESTIAPTTTTADVSNNGVQPISAELLASLPYSDLDVYVQKRHVFFRPEVQAEEPVQTKKYKEYYAGVGVMPAAFNPDVQLKEAPMAFSAQSVSQRRAVTSSSEARASYAVQTQGGVRLSKHWSVETGISYLRGNSAYDGGGYVLNAYNNAAANVLENALAGLPSSVNSPALADKASNFSNGSLYIDVAKKVSNNYQYLQMPVQAGFTLNPDKKLSYSVLGGMMANFFLVNELESASGDIIRTTASDDIYRGMNWAASTGLRLNYKMSSKWGANLTGSYQKSVTSGFNSNQSLDSRPYLYGVSWSVRYSF